MESRNELWIPSQSLEWSESIADYDITDKYDKYHYHIHVWTLPVLDISIIGYVDIFSGIYSKNGIGFIEVYLKSL